MVAFMNEAPIKKAFIVLLVSFLVGTNAYSQINMVPYSQGNELERRWAKSVPVIVENKRISHTSNPNIVWITGPLSGDITPVFDSQTKLCKTGIHPL